MNYTDDKVKRNSMYKKDANYKKETINFEDIKIATKKAVLETRLKYCERVFKQTHSFELDLFQLTDYEFVNWANSQKETHVIAVMAEMKKSPKLKPEIELLRKDVTQIPLLSIDEYRKTKRLGVRSVSFLHKMKKLYGNYVLKILYLTSNHP
jgi:hypothetical protein